MSADATLDLLTWLLIGTFALLCLLLAAIGLGSDPVEREHRRQLENQERQP
jgi:hypothetical protein